MKSLILKLFFTLIGACFILVFALPWNYFGLQVPFSGPDYKLGLDLQGGIELDYKVDLTEVKKEDDYDSNRKNAVIEGLKSIIDKRIESLNINDSVITGASYGGEEHIIVQIPLKGNDAMQNSENIERAKAAIGKVVTIEFKKAREQITQSDIEKRKELANSAYKKLTGKDIKFSVEAASYANNYEKVLYGTTSDINTNFTLNSGTGKITENTPELLVKNASGEEGYLVFQNTDDNLQEYIFIAKEPSIWEPAKDSKGRVLNDKYFSKASVQYNEVFTPMVELTFNNE